MTRPLLGSTELLSRQDICSSGADALGAFEAEPAAAGVDRRRSRARLLRAALVDRFTLSRDCLVQILGDLDLSIDMSAFAGVAECAAAEAGDWDLVIYNHHAGTELAGPLAELRRAVPGVPVIVLSEADGERDGLDALAASEGGARGFIPTRTTGISMLSAAIGVVMAGGTFVPLELLMSPVREASPVHAGVPGAVVPGRLTARQTAVLGLIRQGKANKIIAHELRMSESTVKVHVRNVLRKMGATNRTQAAYYASGSDGRAA